MVKQKFVCLILHVPKKLSCRGKIDRYSRSLRRKANRVYRGLYRCKHCGMELNADIKGALNIIRKVAPEEVVCNLQWGSSEITSPSRIRVVEFA